MRTSVRTIRIAFALLWLAAASALLRADPPAASAPDDVRIVLLHVNDTHGQTAGTGEFGGEARLATLVDEFRAGAGDRQPPPARIFLLHSGDILSRGDAITRKTLGAANFTLMNRLRFDAWTPGNGDIYDGLAVLQARMAEAKFPTLAANVKVKATGQPLGTASILEQAGPVKVAFFGLCFFRAASPGGGSVEVEDPVAAAKRIVPQLRKQADLVVAMTHIGADDDTALAKAVPDIDVILGGHSHTPLLTGLTVRPAPGRRVLICQTQGFLLNVGCATVRMRKLPTGRYEVAEMSDTLIPLGAKVKQDPRVKAFLAREHERVASQPDPAEAEAPAPLGRP